MNKQTTDRKTEIAWPGPRPRLWDGLEEWIRELFKAGPGGRIWLSSGLDLEYSAS